MSVRRLASRDSTAALDRRFRSRVVEDTGVRSCYDAAILGGREETSRWTRQAGTAGASRPCSQRQPGPSWEFTTPTREGHRHGRLRWSRATELRPGDLFRAPPAIPPGRRKDTHTRLVRDLAFGHILFVELTVGEYRTACGCGKTFHSPDPRWTGHPDSGRRCVPATRSSPDPVSVVDQLHHPPRTDPFLHQCSAETLPARQDVTLSWAFEVLAVRRVK